MKKLLSLATLAVLLGAFTGCSSCDKTPGCDDDKMFGLGMFHKKHFGFGKSDCDSCGVAGGPILDGGIGQSAGGCGCGSTGTSVSMPVQQSGCGCESGGVSSQHMPVSMSSGGMSGLPAGTIVTESIPTPAGGLGGSTFRGANPGMGVPGPE